MPTATKAKPVETQIANAVYISRDRIRANPDQPREYFDEAELQSLAASIREHGLLQPLVVRYEPSRYDGTPYQIVAGERRYRASEHILELLPCIISNATAEQARQLALIENLQRRDLTALEEAKGLRDLMKEQNLSMNKAAKVLGLSMGWVQNRIELLRTGEDVQAVAARQPYKMSSLLLIDGVKDKPTREDLLKQVESGAAHSAIKKQIEEYRENEQQQKQAAKQSTHAPDTQTQTRINQVAQNGHGTMSRGKLVTGTKSSDARQVIETALLRMETDFKSLCNFYDAAPPAARNAARKRLHELSKRFGELE